MGVRLKYGKRTYNIPNITPRVRVKFFGRYYRPKRFGRVYKIRIGGKYCRIKRRGQAWVLKYKGRTNKSRKFQILFKRRFITVTRKKGGQLVMRYAGRKILGGFKRYRYFKYRKRKVFVTRSRRNKRYYKFFTKGSKYTRKIYYRTTRRLTGKFVMIKHHPSINLIYLG